MEAEVVTIRDDVTESRASQIGVLWRRINDVLGLRVDAVSEVSRLHSPLVVDVPHKLKCGKKKKTLS